MSCPRGRVISDIVERRFLPSGYLNQYVCEAYKSGWVSIRSGARDFYEDEECANNALSINSFLRVWRLHFPWLLIASGGSDYCDKCTSTTHYIKNKSGDEKITLCALCVCIGNKQIMSSSTTRPLNCLQSTRRIRMYSIS